MRKIFLIVCLLTFLTPLLPAQTIKGKQVNADNSTIEYASVALFDQKDSSLVTGEVTKPGGEFKIDNIKPGNYFLTARFMGYEAKTISNITLKKKEDFTLPVITLQPNQQMLNEIQVIGEKVTAIHKVDRQVYEADKFQVSQGGTATDVLRNLPSITVNGQGEISARGSTGFVILLNGKPIQTEASVILNQLPANALQNIEIITAPSAKYDPEGKAGIINIITKKGATDGFFAQFNARLGMPSIEDYDNAEAAHRFGGDFILNYRKNKWDLSLGASYLRNDITGRRAGDVFTIQNNILTRFPSDGERSFDELNYSTRFSLGFTPDPNNNFSLGFYAGERSKDRTADILYYDNHAIAAGGERFYTFQYYNENLRIRRGDFVLGSFDYTHLFKNNSRLTTSLLYEYTLLGGPTTNRNLGWPNTDIVYQDEFNTNDNPLHGIRFQADYVFQPFSFGTVEAGYQFRDLDHTGDFVYERKNNETL